MKSYQIIVDFRKAYRKLNYVENGLTVNDLRRWVENWCKENDIEKAMFSVFEELAFSYVDQDLDIWIITHHVKRKQQRRKEF